MSEEQIKEAEERAVTGHLPKETAVEETAATTTEENPEETGVGRVPGSAAGDV